MKKRTPKAATRAAEELPATPTAKPIARPAQRRNAGSLNEAIDADTRRVVSIFNEVESTGRTARQIDLYKGTRRIDSRLNSVCNARILSISGRPLQWKPPAGFETDAVANENARILTQQGFLRLADGIDVGHAHGKTGWAVAGVRGSGKRVDSAVQSSW